VASHLYHEFRRRDDWMNLMTSLTSLGPSRLYLLLFTKCIHGGLYT
jgi:hypothetical protein